MARTKNIPLRPITKTEIRRLWKASGLTEMPKKRAAALLGTSPQTIDRWLSTGAHIPRWARPSLIMFAGASAETLAALTKAQLAKA